MSTEWFYTTNKQQMGPVTWHELRELADGGILKPHDLVWTEGMAEWVKAVNQSGLFAAGEDSALAAPAKKSAYTEAKPPPGRRSKRTETDEDEDEDDEREEKRKARQRDQERAKTAVGVKIALILAGIVFVLVLLAGCAGVLIYLSVGGGGGPAKPGQPPAPVALNLNNTTWVGQENLQGFGRLEFRFRPGGQVTMIDTQRQTPGTYNLQGNMVTLRFEGGQVTYTGTIQPNGRTMTGNARNVKNVGWTFNVSR